MNRAQFISNYQYLHADYEVIDNRIKLKKAPREMQEALEQMPDIQRRMILAWNKKHSATTPATQTQEKEAAPLLTVEAIKPPVDNVDNTDGICSLRDFVKAISLPTKKQLYKSWFTVEEAIEGAKEHGYILTEQAAISYLSYLVSKYYFEKRQNGQTAQYRKLVCSYQMDFWKEPEVNYKWL